MDVNLLKVTVSDRIEIQIQDGLSWKFMLLIMKLFLVSHWTA